MQRCEHHESGDLASAQENYTKPRPACEHFPAQRRESNRSNATPSGKQTAALVQINQLQNRQICAKRSSLS
jgi:hypothetical protein